MMDPNANNVNKEDVLDELLDKLVKDAKERVHKVADQYCLMSFSCVRIEFIFNALHSSPSSPFFPPLFRALRLNSPVTNRATSSTTA
jgi:hypothetical protein